MKEKKYFYKRYQNWCELNGGTIWYIIWSLIIIGLIITIVPATVKCSHLVNYYLEVEHEYLSEVAENIYDSDTQTLYLLRKTDDVLIEDIKLDDNHISFKCTLKGTTFIKPTILVETSDDLETLIITPPKKYNYYVQFFTYYCAFLTIGVLLIVFIIWLILATIRILSFLHEKFDITKNSKKTLS